MGFTYSLVHGFSTSVDTQIFEQIESSGIAD